MKADAWRSLKRYISDPIERFSLKVFCSSQWQNPLRVNARTSIATEGYWQLELLNLISCGGSSEFKTFHSKGANHESVFADVPGNRLQSLKITLLKSDPYYSSTYSLVITSHASTSWSLNWDEVAQDKLK